MAKLTCKCGETLSNGLVPNDVVLHVFSDNLMDEILRKDDISTTELYSLAKQVWECDKCGRLYSFIDDDRVAKVYLPEV